jgi:[ribosomal protein S5]-alanine N-acetyltransferase
VISLAEAAAFVDASISNFARFGYGLWLVSEKSGKRRVGFAGLLSPAHGAPNLVYGMRREFCGRGYASEAAFAVLRHSFDTLHLPRIMADVDEPNVASIRILEKLGMSRVGYGTVKGRPLLYFAVDEKAMRPSHARRREALLR